jgi:hypothetical protein
MARWRLSSHPDHRPPQAVRVVLATVLSLVGSLVADAVIVRIGTRVFPTTRGYTHFQLHDYGKLTVVGVIIACVAWPVVCRFTDAPRWLFCRLAVLVTLVLLLPDVYILHQGQPPRAVAVLMVMHLAIGLITYNLLVYVAPTRSISGAAQRRTIPRDSDQRGAMPST